jgi:hypothetical protein
MTELSTSRPRPRRLLIGGLAAAAVAGAAATVLVVAQSGSGTPGSPTARPLHNDRISLMAASEVLGKASDAAAAGPDLKPRPGQLLYFASTSRQNGGPATPRKAWLSVDGKHPGLIDQSVAGHRMYVWICSDKQGGSPSETADLKHPPKNCHDQPAYSPSVPTDPAAAKAWLYRNSRGGNPPDVQAFITVGDTIREHYVPAKALAALFKAAAQIPGVKVYRNVVDSAGRRGIAVGQTWRYDRQELIFDPTTYKLIGEREVCDTESSFHPAGESKTDLPTGVPCKNGQVGYSSAETGFGVVDRPGQLP